MSNLDTSPVASISARTVPTVVGLAFTVSAICRSDFSGRRLDQLGDQLALLLGGQVAAMDVGADDVGVGIDRAVQHDDLVDREEVLASRNARRADNRRTDFALDRVKTAAAVEQECL